MSDRSAQHARATAFRAMHAGPGVLVLPNAWDAASARIFADAGFGALATTSAGIAFAQGLPDGQRIAREAMLAAVARIVAAVDVPVTADAEAGYGPRPEDAARTATAVVASGAVGMNLEDTTGDPARPLADLTLQVEKVQAVKEAGRAAGVDLVINARTDVYLLGVGPAAERYDETLRRLSAFRDAGADCVFVPGLRDPDAIRRLVGALRCPLNVLAVPGCPSAPELQRLGVARVSLGSGPMRATLTLLRRMADELQSAGTWSLLDGAISHAEVNGLFEGRPGTRPR